MMVFNIEHYVERFSDGRVKCTNPDAQNVLQSVTLNLALLKTTPLTMKQKIKHQVTKGHFPAALAQIIIHIIDKENKHG